MKKIALIPLGLLPALAFAASSGTFIGTNGASWQTAANWQGGAYPALAGDNTYNIAIDANNAIMNLRYNGAYSGGGNRTMNITMGDGVENATIMSANSADAFTTTLNFASLSGTRNIYLTDEDGSSANKVSISGDIKAGTSLYINSAKYNLSNWDSSYMNGTVYVNAGTAEAPITIKRFSSAGSVYISAGHALRSTAAMNLQGANSMIDIAAGATYTAALGVRSKNYDVKGSLIVTGARPYKTAADSINFMVTGKAVFREGSTFSNTYNTPSGARPVANGSGASIYSYASAGALSSAQAIQISGGATLVLNSQNAWAIGDGGEQNFLVSLYTMETAEAGHVGDGATTGNLRIGLDADTGATISVAKNTIDNLKLYANSTLNLWLGGNDVEVVHLTQVGDTSNPFSLVLQDDIERGSLIVQDFNGLVTVDDVRSYISTGAGTTGELFVESVSDSFYIYTVAVPEPAEWAFIFGALALGAAAYRRRK